jgi:hypothetical protein
MTEPWVVAGLGEMGRCDHEVDYSAGSCFPTLYLWSGDGV